MENPVLVRADKLRLVMRRAGIDAVRIAVDRDGGRRDRRLRGEPLLDRCIGRVACDEAVAVAI